MDYARWYATQWALRMMDVVEHHDPDFIYTDGTDAGHLDQPVKSVELLGHAGKLQWKQEAGGLVITCQAEMPFASSVVCIIE